ncbi:MAG TPA: hypothetical protein VK110_06025, partial [Salinisphaeraceae bacterium]|nr:hypothetical protein [Salinisphaeraceae bacterium]
MGRKRAILALSRSFLNNCRNGYRCLLCHAALSARVDAVLLAQVIAPSLEIEQQLQFLRLIAVFRHALGNEFVVLV